MYALVISQKTKNPIRNWFYSSASGIQRLIIIGLKGPVTFKHPKIPDLLIIQTGLSDKWSL